MDKKRLTTLAVSFLIAIVFIISYTSFLGTGTIKSTSTTTASAGPTVFATAAANAVIVGFSPSMNVSVKCANSVDNSHVYSELSNGIATLEANNSVSAFLPLQDNISVEAGNANTLQIYNYEYAMLNSTGVQCTTFTTGEIAQLPAQVTFVVQSQKVPVALQNSTRSYVLQTTLMQNMSYVIPVKISALLTENGLVYGNLSIART